MKLGDKIGYWAQRGKGKVKEVTGKVTGNRKLESEGKAEQAKAKVKQAARQVKDAIKDVLD